MGHLYQDFIEIYCDRLSIMRFLLMYYNFTRDFEHSMPHITLLKVNKTWIMMLFSLVVVANTLKCKKYIGWFVEMTACLLFKRSIKKIYKIMESLIPNYPLIQEKVFEKHKEVKSWCDWHKTIKPWLWCCFH